MGLFALTLPSLLLRNHIQQHTNSYDPEKAVHDQLERPSQVDPPQLMIHQDDSDADHYHPSEDILSTNTPHRRIRRVYSNVAGAAFSDPAHTNASTDDLTIPPSSFYARIKAYVWPSDDQLTNLDTFVPNYRWTPIISGIVIPFSILLEIPGLTERWYIRTENNKTVETQPNPVILDVGLAFSFVCALIANIALVLRFLEKRVQTVTLLCIVFLTIHDIINIIAVTIFGVEHRFDDGFTYGEAFWMTLCSTITSTITNVSLIVDLLRTPDFAKRGSGLTRKQRALMIIVIAFLVYMAFGALINSLLLHLSFIDGLYFTVVSIETIGFGDISPKSTGARVWTCFYVVFGVINIGVAIAMCRETILEGLEIGYRRRMRDMRQRRREARRFRRWETRWQSAVEFRLRENDKPIWVPDERPPRSASEDRIPVLGLLQDLKMPFFNRVGTTIKRTATMTSMEPVFRGHRNQHLNVDALTTAQLEEAALEAGVPLEMFFDMNGRRRHSDDTNDSTSEVHGLPAHLAQSDHGSSPAPAQSHCAQTFHHTISRGWPSDPQTPTHAQVGRMSAMLTKFAVTVAGTPTHVLGDAHTETRAFNGGGPTCSHPSAHGTDVGHSGRPRNDHATSFLDIRKHPAAKWLKDFSRGTNQRSVWTYEKYKADMEAEEKKAYYVKLTIAWVLFILFWTIGSGIFCVTEGWPYGTAMYFCFVAFSTTGYGDFSPQTPAGRSVFVVWALFGVGTLTILVSVLQEAGSSRYKSALHSRAFDKAVKKYRKKQLQESRQHPRPIIGKNVAGAAAHPAKGHKLSGSPHHQPKPTADRPHEAQEVSRKALEALPGEIVQMSKTFRDYMQFFVSGRTDGVNPLEDHEAGNNTDGGSGSLKIPPDMRKLLDEIAQMAGMNERVKAEILQDDDARKTLFMLSLERSLKQLVASAEKAISALADRDALATISAVQRPPPVMNSLSVSNSPDETEPSLPTTHHHLHVRHTHTRRHSTLESSIGEVPRDDSSRSYARCVAEDDSSSTSSAGGS